MICLWAFLLLAVATSSVNSQACSCPCTNNNDVKEAIQENSDKITNTKPDSKLNLEGLLQSLLNTVTSITNLIFLDAKVETGELRNVTNGWELRAGLIIGASCLELQTFKIIANISAKLNLAVKDGYSYWRLLEDTLNISASVNGEKVLGLSSTILKSVVDTVLKVLQGVLKNILNLVVAKLNYVNKEVTRAFYVGNQQFSNKINKVKQQGGNAVGEITTAVGSQEEAWEQVGENILKESETHSWNIGSNIAAKIIKSVVQQINTKINIGKEQLSSQSWASQYGTLYVGIKMSSLKSWEFTENGADLGVNVGVSLYNMSQVVANLEGNVQVKAQPVYDRGHLSFHIPDISAKPNINLSVTSVDSKCGCGDKIGAWVSDIVNRNINLFYKDFNCNARRIMPLPPVTGTPGPEGKCESRQGYCRCSSTKTKV